MNIKPVIFFVLSILFFEQASHAQLKNVRNVGAFAKEMSYGQELRGLDGNSIERRDTAYFIYLEVKGKSEPKPSQLSFNGRNYAPSVYPVTEKTVIAGINKITNKKIIIRKSAACSLWRVELNPLQGSSGTSPKKTILKGTLNGRSFSLPIKKFIQLEADVMG